MGEGGLTSLTAVAAPPAPPSTVVRRRRRRRPVLPRLAHFASFGAPGVLVYLCFVMAPILISFGYSLTNYNPFHPPVKFVGFDNYRLLFTDSQFLTALQVTTILTLIVVIVPNVLGLGVALLLDRKGWLYNALRSVFFTPVILSSVVVSIVWSRLLDDRGPLNSLLRDLGVSHPPGWLSDPDVALYSVASIVCWQMLGFCVVVYLAGLQGVPPELLEAAEIDGAGPLRRFRAVTWPLLAPSLTINTVVLLISAFKTYDYVKVITNGGPGSGATATIAFDVLQTGFDSNHVGYASAMAVLMLVIVALVTTVVLNFLRRREVDL
ncbi:sugar ABC transporter permease [Amycolatopsis mediterranei S699]|uniref:Permease component of ABC-type sugar transport system n=3 Tax=Amycolatopsis mediterranei TaxID=33910 RepID=A0A0H3DB73_AMYMU|nr:sugar ABC transporter permease [Amycolatopsis mediterranei]ADJ46809.1 permease component of ABC-type sugar transport system [Amycolatopsis mediterranei U32]AEK43614.1 sugar ABC transporter permease [Amycolatopsis mediterranei S699]AFO78520.1 sugar ABC transporter permease [Amycolatopsis mediterranei S699]AGT85648.1 sugar ABC transporter permease [Amycolatopsis mediterranei RB]KDO11287.1 sugar ABC transporter permease [Amycolatopsis mediterranei]